MVKDHAVAEHLRESPPSESADQDVVTYRSGAGPATTPWQRTTQQCWSEHQQPRRCKLPQCGAGEAEQTRIGAHEAEIDATRTMTTRKSQAVRPEEANEREDACNACWKHREVTRRRERGRQRISQPGKRQKKK